MREVSQKGPRCASKLCFPCKNAISKNSEATVHREKIAPLGGEIPPGTMLAVHEPIAIKDALRIPEAKQALDKEWAKLVKQGAWDPSMVKEYADVKNEA